MYDSKADEEIRTSTLSWQGDALPLSYIRKLGGGHDRSTA